MGINGIKKIEIEKIKGIDKLELYFDDLLLANKVNILVANNGFGKTSISKALSYLKEPRIALRNDDVNENNPGLPKIEIEYLINNKLYKKNANWNGNEIRDDLEFLVIDSPLRAAGTGGVAVLTTENVNICRIYDKLSYDYKMFDFLKEYQLEAYSKLFKLVAYIDDDELLLLLKDYKDCLNNPSLNSKIFLFLKKLNLAMTKKEIFEFVEKNNLISIIFSSNSGNLLFNVIKEYEIKNGYYFKDVTTIFNFIQIYYLYNDKKKINDKLKYVSSKTIRNYCLDIINKCNTTKKGYMRNIRIHVVNFYDLNYLRFPQFLMAKEIYYVL